MKTRTTALIPQKAANKKYQCYNCRRVIQAGEPYCYFMKVGTKCPTCRCARATKKCLCSNCEPVSKVYAERVQLACAKAKGGLS